MEQPNVVVMSRSWPAFSLDANYFEHLLDDFQRHLNIFQPRPATTDELFAICSPDMVRRLNNVHQSSDSFHEQNVIIIHATECKETLYVIIRKYLSDYTWFFIGSIQINNIYAHNFTYSDHDIILYFLILAIPMRYAK